MAKKPKKPKKRNCKTSDIFPAKERKCSVCEADLPARRRRYCSDACMEHANVCSNPSYARKQLYKKDRGVCAMCGVKTRPLERGRHDIESKNGQMIMYLFPDHAWTARGGKVWANRTLWEADHIVPVCEGGLHCGLDGYRTLCLMCHRSETEKLRKRRQA